MRELMQHRFCFFVSLLPRTPTYGLVLLSLPTYLHHTHNPITWPMLPRSMHPLCKPTLQRTKSRVIIDHGRGEAVEPAVQPRAHAWPRINQEVNCTSSTLGARARERSAERHDSQRRTRSTSTAAGEEHSLNQPPSVGRWGWGFSPAVSAGRQDRHRAHTNVHETRRSMLVAS